MALVYLIAFVAALRQFKPLIGSNGITPFQDFVKQVNFWKSPSIFHHWNSDKAMRTVCWTGTLLSFLTLLGVPSLLHYSVTMISWLILWILYLSIVNVGRVWYSYGWESKLLEAGFLAVFLGGFGVEASVLMIFLIRWMLFRVMFGAGLIKLRGDSCWKDLTALNYHYLTQPMPNPASWFLHRLPEKWHKTETFATHFTQLIVPFFYFAPQPFAAIAGITTILFHLALMAGGNYSWLNLLTLIIAFSTIPDQIINTLISIPRPALTQITLPHQILIYGYTLLVAGLSYYPVKNMVSSGQVMNTSFNPFHLVNTYGAFGSITETRFKVVIEGKNEEDSEWKEYRFPGKPSKTGSMPPQVAPYHLRLDWQLWFAAMTPRPRRKWFQNFMYKIYNGDKDINKLIKENPFPDGPDKLRAKRYRYNYSDWKDLSENGEWWTREEVGIYFPDIRE